MQFAEFSQTGPIQVTSTQIKKWNITSTLEAPFMHPTPRGSHNPKLWKRRLVFVLYMKGITHPCHRTFYSEDSSVLLGDLSYSLTCNIPTCEYATICLSYLSNCVLPSIHFPDGGYVGSFQFGLLRIELLYTFLHTSICKQMPSISVGDTRRSGNAGS